MSAPTDEDVAQATGFCAAILETASGESMGVGTLLTALAAAAGRVIATCGDPQRARELFDKHVRSFEELETKVLVLRIANLKKHGIVQ